MFRRLFALSLVALTLAACATRPDVVASPTPMPSATPARPAEAVPATPDVTEGWVSVFEGVGREGDVVTSDQTPPTPGPVAVSVSCTGLGTVIVVIGAVRVGGPVGEAAISASYPCGGPGKTKTTRFEIPAALPHNPILSAFVVAPPDNVKLAVFSLLVEQPNGLVAPTP